MHQTSKYSHCRKGCQATKMIKNGREWCFVGKLNCTKTFDKDDGTNIFQVLRKMKFFGSCERHQKSSTRTQLPFLSKKTKQTRGMRRDTRLSELILIIEL